MSEAGRWSGTWVRDLLGVEVVDDSAAELGIEELCGLALRINPKRPHLLVSTVLGKHVPTDPRVVRGAGLLLGHRVAVALGRAMPGGAPVGLLRDDPGAVEQAVAGIEPGPGLVVGYAETATALGHLVARALGLPSIHSTRRRVVGYQPALGFDEAHSHAVEHLVLPDDPGLLSGDGPAILVDDELSTGRTALNTIRALHDLRPRERYVIAALVDCRRAADRETMAGVAAELGAAIEVVSLGSGEVRLPADAAERAAGTDGAASETPGVPGEVVAVDRGWPVGVRESGRHGFGPADEPPLDAAAHAVAAGLDVGERVLVLGTEELMYAPLAIADALVADGREVRFSTTTRSPVKVIDDPGYPIRSVVGFRAHDRDSDGHDSDGAGADRYAYNTSGDWTDLVVVVDTPAWTAWFRDSALPTLATAAARVHVVVLPVTTGRPPVLHGPAFGSYRPDEVSWLLTDLSDVRLEADLATREQAIQLGTAHYAESLPVEYVPEPAYRELYAEQLAEVSARVATAAATVAELARATRGRDDLVLVSLARAGTPIGILMRRWAARAGWDWPHHTMSIVRDRGIDLVAMRHLADRYDTDRVLFVDGWTGKGAITREFAEAVADANEALGLGDQGFRDELAVLADPGECVELFGTRDDFLIPSACLNSTVSGLVSRTVLNTDLIGPGDFHGAKFYADLAAEDVSGAYLDAVSGRYDEVADAAVAEAAELLTLDRSPTWVGWRAAEQIREDYGLPSINLVKPGVGETTRVLLRRIPWRVVVNPDRRGELRHVEMLAAARGVPVVPVDGLPYSCVGLIRPTEPDGS